MMTFNEKHHWVFSLVPTSCSYAKLGGYFAKLQKSQMAALQAQGDFADHLEVRKVAKTKNRRLGSKMGKSKNDCFGHERANPQYFCANGEFPFRK